MSKSKATEFSFLRIVQEECTTEDFRQIIQTTVQQAKDGDPAARLFLAAYTIGSPKHSTLALSTLDVSEAMNAQSAEMLTELYPKRKTRG